MSGAAIRLSKFQDQPKRRITASKQRPLTLRTRMLRAISCQRRNASQSDKRISETIGTTSFHRFRFTLRKIPCPSNSHPESQTPVAGSSCSRETKREPGAVLLGGGVKNPRTRKWVELRAANFEKIHRLTSLVGQKRPSEAAAVFQVESTCSASPKARSVKPACCAAASSRPRWFDKLSARDRFRVWNSARGQS